MTKTRIVAGVMIFIAIVISWLHLFVLYNRLRIQFKRDQYRENTFIVVDTVYPFSRKGMSSLWLAGTVEGHNEHLHPSLPPGSKAKSKEDLLSPFPRGTALPVLYDPQAPEIKIQGETLRVLHFTPDFWQKENWRCIKYLCFVFLPVPSALLFYRYAKLRA